MSQKKTKKSQPTKQGVPETPADPVKERRKKDLYVAIDKGFKENKRFMLFCVGGDSIEVPVNELASVWEVFAAMDFYRQKLTAPKQQQQQPVPPAPVIKK